MHVENKTLKMVANRFSGCLRRFRDDDARVLKRSNAIHGLKWWLLFLLHREPNPEHYVIGDISMPTLAEMAVLYVAILMASVMGGLTAFGYYGWVGLGFAIFGIGIAILTVPHIIWDRPKNKH